MSIEIFDDVLLKLKLLKKYRIDIENKDSIINQLDMIVTKGYYHPLLFIFDTLVKEPKKYIGNLNQKGFKIRSKFSTEVNDNFALSYINGTFKKSKNKKTHLEISIRSIGYLFLTIVIPLLLVWLLGLILFISEGLMIPKEPDYFQDNIFIFLFLSSFLFMMIFIPYRIIKYSIRNTTNNFNEILQLITKNSKPL